MTCSNACRKSGDTWESILPVWPEGQAPMEYMHLRIHTSSPQSMQCMQCMQWQLQIKWNLTWTKKKKAARQHKALAKWNQIESSVAKNMANKNFNSHVLSNVSWHLSSCWHQASRSQEGRWIILCFAAMSTGGSFWRLKAGQSFLRCLMTITDPFWYSKCGQLWSWSWQLMNQCSVYKVYTISQISFQLLVELPNWDNLWSSPAPPANTKGEVHHCSKHKSWAIPFFVEDNQTKCLPWLFYGL